jgi:hypothetical protein
VEFLPTLMNGGSCCVISTPEDTNNPFEFILSTKAPGTNRSIFYSFRLELICKKCEETNDLRIMTKCTHAVNKRPNWQKKSRAPLIGYLMDALKGPVDNVRENLGKVCDKYPPAFPKSAICALFGLNRSEEIDEELPCRIFNRIEINQSDLCRFFYSSETERDLDFVCGGSYFKKALMTSEYLNNQDASGNYNEIEPHNSVSLENLINRNKSIKRKNTISLENITGSSQIQSFSKSHEKFYYSMNFISNGQFWGNLFMAIDPDSDGKSNLCIVTGYVLFIRYRFRKFYSHKMPRRGHKKTH